MIVSAAGLVIAAASAGPSAIATSGAATTPVVTGRAIGVTSFATAAPPRASRSEIRTPIGSALASPAALSDAVAHALPLTPFTESPASGAIAMTAAITVAAPTVPAAAIAAAAQVAKPAPSTKVVVKPAPLWVRPNGGALSSPFGRRWGRLHAGIDLAGSYGSTIVAATAGIVVFSGPEEGYGRIVKIQDSDGTQTWYAHMSRYLVKPGDHVRAGQRIALVGSAGDATGPHLHFEVHVGGTPVNPIPFLRKHGVRI